MNTSSAEQPAVATEAAAAARMAGEPVVSIRSLDVEFDAQGKVGKKVAVNKANLDVMPGEFVVLVGPSGCGKTTILNVVADLQEPTRGEVLINGMTPPRARGHVGYMFATDSLFPWRTVVRNVELSFDMRRSSVPKAERRKRALALLEEVGLPNAAHQFPRQLSHGMRQRAALARTWAQDPDLLLMDEPFGALDAQTRTVVQDAFLASWARHRKTVMFVTHDLDEAILMADRIVVITEGVIREELIVPFERPRPHQELLGDPKFHEMRQRLLKLLGRTS